MNQDFKFCICDFETTGVDFKKSLPIEVGCVFTNAQFDVLDTYHAMIMWEYYKGKDEWGAEGNIAYTYHQISIEEYQIISKPVENVCTDIIYHINNINRIKGNRKTILLSDNAAFEFNFMKMLFDEAKMEFPFHYCAWDSSLLLETIGVGDPPGDIVSHRALEDAGQLHKYIVRALDKINYFK